MKKYIVNISIVGLILSSCASNSNVEMIDESSEGLISYIDFSKVDKEKDNFNLNTFEVDKTECAIAASTADIDGNDLANIGAASVGAAAGAASASTAAASAAAGPIALLSVGIVYGAQKLSSRKRAAPIKTALLASCLTERGYEVSIRQR